MLACDIRATGSVPGLVPQDRRRTRRSEDEGIQAGTLPSRRSSCRSCRPPRQARTARRGRLGLRRPRKAPVLGARDRHEFSQRHARAAPRQSRVPQDSAVQVLQSTTCLRTASEFDSTTDACSTRPSRCAISTSATKNVATPIAEKVGAAFHRRAGPSACPEDDRRERARQSVASGAQGGCCAPGLMQASLSVTVPG